MISETSDISDGSSAPSTDTHDDDDDLGKHNSKSNEGNGVQWHNNEWIPSIDTSQHPIPQLESDIGREWRRKRTTGQYISSVDNEWKRDNGCWVGVDLMPQSPDCCQGKALVHACCGGDDLDWEYVQVDLRVVKFKLCLFTHQMELLSTLC